MSAKGNPEKVNPGVAMQAWKLANGDRKNLYSHYIALHFRATGSLVPGCDNRDLQAWLDNHEGMGEK